MTDQFYVGIKEPVEIRKDLLIGSKTILTSLKKYETYKKLREDKKEKILELKNGINELSKSFKKIENIMPKTLKEFVEKENIAQEIKKPKQKTKKEPEEIFEQKLREIEERLGKVE